MLHNDDFNRREYVVKVLLKVLDNFTMEDAINCMQVRAALKDPYTTSFMTLVLQVLSRLPVVLSFVLQFTAVLMGLACKFQFQIPVGFSVDILVLCRKRTQMVLLVLYHAHRRMLRNTAKASGPMGSSAPLSLQETLGEVLEEMGRMLLRFSASAAVCVRSCAQLCKQAAAALCVLYLCPQGALLVRVSDGDKVSEGHATTVQFARRCSTNM